MNQSFSDIWQIQAILLSRLLGWSRLSIVTGLGLWRSNAFWRGVGLQAIGWGLIDGAIALWGGWAMRRRAGLPGPLGYEEVNSGHYMIHSNDPGWPRLEQIVLDFTRAFQSEPAPNLKNADANQTSLSKS